MTKRRYDRWTPERAARAAYLIGTGMTHREVAVDPAIDASPAAVAKVMQRLGIVAGDYSIRLPNDLMKTFEDAGRARNLTTDKAFREAMRMLASDKALLDNIFDDGISTP